MGQIAELIDRITYVTGVDRHQVEVDVQAAVDGDTRRLHQYGLTSSKDPSQRLALWLEQTERWSNGL